MNGKIAILRAPIKQTIVEWEGQVAINDSFFEDVATSSDFWLVFADCLQRYFSEVELWYQTDPEHPVGEFTHSTGLVERFFKKNFETFPGSPDVLFVRGDHKEYYPVVASCSFAQRVYYPSGNYFIPNCDFNWDVCFVEDQRQVNEVNEKTGADIFLFKKSCVDKYFLYWNEPKKYDLCVVCNAPQYKRKRFLLLKDVLDNMEKETTALVIGLTSKKVMKEFKNYPVTFSGFVGRKEIGRYMSQCKIGLVLSSAEGEGSPRVIQEFLASNIPVVITEQGIYSSYYINEKTGRTARVSDSLGKICTKVLERYSQYRPRDYFIENLSMERSIQNFVKCIGLVD